MSASFTMTVTGSPNPTRAFETTLVPIETKRPDSSFYGSTGIASGGQRSAALSAGSSAWTLVGVTVLGLVGALLI